VALTIAILIFVSLTAAVFALGYRRYVRPAALYRGVEAVVASPAPRGFFTVIEIARKIGAKLPPAPGDASRYARDLVTAGYRSASAPAVFYGLKLSLAGVFLLFGLLLQSRTPLALPAQIAYVLLAAIGGFRLPGFFLARRIKERQRKLRRALPDALDLMVVCAEAGCAVDRALRTVSREVEVAHPEFTDELNLMLLEVNAGARRRDALLHMAERTREPEVRKFVTVLVQADRFGTEIAEALRTHAEHLRIRRRQDAEERAGKVSVKLVFPIFLFILPCMLLVTVGPAAIEIWKMVLPAIRGN